MENPNPYAPPVAETTAPPAPSRAAPSGELLSEYAVKRLDRGGHGEAWMLLVYPDRAGVGRWIRPGRWLFSLAALRAIALIVAVGFDVFVLGVAPWLAILALFFMLGALMSIRRFGFFKPAPA